MASGDEEAIACAPTQAATPSAPEQAPERGQLFAPGELVAERYRIVRFIAGGGMGQVYEAEDEELSERLALKTLHPAAHEGATAAAERLRREIQLARKVTHPNVCRIFDFGKHRTGDGRDILFLTMELVRGETLAQRLRAGPLAPEAALPLIEAIAAGLTAAHAVGIVHRDLKPANILLGDGRVVVSDFGLARGPMDGKTRSLTPTAEMIGSPAYMSPEQVEGGEISQRSDVYAFGIVLYEMMTGRLPFVGKGALATALLRLGAPPATPRSLRPELPERWSRVIMRCLALAERERYPSPAQAVLALRGRRGRSRRWPWLVAALAVAGLVAGVGLWAFRRGAEVRRTSGRPSVVVLGLHDLGGRPETAWLGTALGEMLSTELGADEKLRLISGETAARARQELGLRELGALSRETLTRVRDNLGVGHVLVGSYTVQGERVRVDFRLQATRGSGAALSFAEEGEVDRLSELAVRAATGLRRKLGVVGPGSAGQAAHALPASAAAARSYAEGLAATRSGDLPRARELLEATVAKAPEFAQGHAALARVYRDLGYSRRLREEAALARARADGLPREERMLIEALDHEARGEAQRALEIYRALATFFPDDIEHGLRAASAQIVLRDSPGALATLAGLRQLPAPDREDPRIDLLECDAQVGRWDYAAGEIAATRALASAEARHAPVLAAEARIKQAVAAMNLGDGARALELAARARDASAAASYPLGVVRALSAMANIVARAGDPAAAERYSAERIEILRRLGTDAELARALAEIANLPWADGRLDEARRRAEEALALGRRTEERHTQVAALVSLAMLDVSAGRTAAAVRQLGEAQTLADALGSQRLQAWTTGLRGELAMVRGELAEARALGEAALATRERLALPVAVASSRTALARLALEERRWDDAARLAAQAVETYVRDRSADGEASARIALALALLGRGDAAGAEAEAQRAETTAARGSLRVRLEASRALARVLGARDPAAARARLAAVVASARQHGLEDTAEQAELATLPLLPRAERDAARRALAEAADAAGFGLLARQARAR